MKLSSKGFTLIELMIVVAIIAILMAILIPSLLRARIAANETAAIGCIKSVTTSQEQFKQAAVVDTDGNGAGEFGYFQELGGVEPFRTGSCGLSSSPALPPYLTSSLGISAQLSTSGLANKSGYFFRIFLPDSEGTVSPGVPEANPIPCDVTRSSEQEQRWVVYGWPAAIRISGNSCFFGSRRADVYGAQNVTGANYDGETTQINDGNAALAPGETNLDGSPPGAPDLSTDLQIWQGV